jgi:hypothetical protein
VKRSVIVRHWLVLMALVIMAACQPPTGNGTTEATHVETEEVETVTEDEESEVPPEGPVAILVVDDFYNVTAEEEGGGESPVPEPEETEGGTCAVTPDGQIYRGEGLIYRGEGLTWLKITGVSHGMLVYTQLQGLIDAGATRTDSITGPQLMTDLSAAGATGLWESIGLDWMGEVTVWERNRQPLLLVQVDTSGYDSTVLADRIQAAMEALGSSTWQVKRFVLNMSFGFIPCDLTLTAEEYERLLEQYEELQALQESLEGAVGQEQLTQEDADAYLLAQATLRKAYEFEPGDLPDWLKQDPVLNLLIEMPASAEALIAVASSGNSGLSFPYAPAIWDDVIAVSSETTNAEGGPVIADYANDGEVMMPDKFVYNGETVFGTSFAAPKLSLRAAYYLLAGVPVSCRGAILPAVEPPFDYATPAGPWDNLTLTDARTNYCPPFPP